MSQPEREEGGLFRILFSWPGLMIVLSVAGLVAGSGDFELSRPAAGSSVDGNPSKLRFESRSWQDPFQGIRIAGVKLTALTNSPNDYGLGLEELGEELLKRASNNRVAIVAIPVNGNPYPHNTEMRIRTRVALQSAMRAGGFVREDGTHVRYFLLRVRDEAPAGGERTVAVDSSSAGDNCVTVAYEWFRKDKTLPGTGSSFEKVLVLWLKEEQYSNDFLTSLASMIDCLVGPGAVDLPAFRKNTTLALFGPRSSGGLESLMESASKMRVDSAKSSPGKGLLQTLRIVSTSATAPDAFLCEPAVVDDGRYQSRARVVAAMTNALKGSSFKPFGRTDEELCFMLIGELYLRGINPVTDRIILLSEYDTFYGRQLPLTFKAAVLAVRDTFHGGSADSVTRAHELFSMFARTSTTGALMRRSGELMRSFETNLATIRSGAEPAAANIEHYTFLAGMDGSKTMQDNPKDSGSGNELMREKRPDSLDRPEGDQQLDYMRRLAEELGTGIEGIFVGKEDLADVRAVGLLGNDFYDKLIILQALRPKLPGCVFFTTDLDARMTHSSRHHWTRNLVVATSYDLKPPRESTSLRIPPFRDSYQTAMFMGCLDFLADRTSKTLKSHDLALFEIGRDFRHRLSLDPRTELRFADVIWDVEGKITRMEWWAEQIRTVPQLLARAPSLMLGMAALIMVMIAVFLPLRRALGFSYLGFLGGGVVWFGLSSALILWLFSNRLEPLEIGDGVSALSSVLLLSVALGMGAFTVFLGYRVEGVLKTSAWHWSLALCAFAIVPATLFLLWEVNVPIRGERLPFKLVFVGTWCMSSTVTVYVASFWVIFCRKVGSFAIEARYACTYPWSVRNTHIPSVINAAIAAVQSGTNHASLRRIVREQVAQLKRLARDCPDPKRNIARVAKIEKRMLEKMGATKGSRPVTIYSIKRAWSKYLHCIDESMRPRAIHDLICEAHELSDETDKYDNLLVYPMVIILFVILACSPWSDSWRWTVWMWLLIGFKILLLIIPPVLLNRTAGRIRLALNQNLDNQRISAAPGASTGILEGHQALVDRLNRGCFASLHNHPVFAALAGVLGGSGFLNLLQPLLTGHW